MSLRGLLALYRARLRARAVLVQELLAVVGIAVGVALLFASQVAATSLSSSVAQVDKQVIGSGEQFQLQARSEAGMSEALLTKVRRLPGVGSAFALLEQQANLEGPHGQRSVDLVGLAPRFARLAGPLAKKFSTAQLAAMRAIALPQPIAQAIGVESFQLATVQISGHVTSTLIAATLGKSEIGSMVNNPVAVAPIAFAQKLANTPGRISRIFIHVDSGMDSRVRTELAGLADRENINLEPANFDTTLFSVAVSPDSQSEALFSAISALVGFAFALNALLITAPSRRRLIEEVRRNGATRIMLLQILTFDGLVLAAISCVLGLALGDLLSIAAFHSTPGYLAFAFPVGNNRIITTDTVALAAAAGIIASLVGVVWPVCDMLAVAPHTRRARSPAAQRARLALGMFALALSVLILLVDTAGAILGEVTLVIALLCLLPTLVGIATGFLERSQARLGGPASRLAATELAVTQTRVRSLAITATAALAVLGAVEFGGLTHNLSKALDASAHGIDSKASIWVTPDGESNAFATTAFPDTRRHALEHIQGVASVGLYRGSFLNWGKRRLWVLAPASNVPNPLPAGELLHGDTKLAASRVAHGGWAVLSEALADEHHLRIGQLFTLPAPHPIRLRLAGLSTNLGWAPGAMILNQTDYATAWNSTAPSAYQLQLTPGTQSGPVRAAVQRALGQNSGLAVETAPEREQRHYRLAAQGLSRLTQIRLLLLIAALLAVTGAMGAMIWQRRDRVAFIKCEGYPRSVLLRSLVYETALLFIVGCTTGAIFGLFGQLLGSHFLADVTGFPIAYGIEGVAALTAFAIMAGLAVAILSIPGYLVVRVPARTVNPAY